MTGTTPPVTRERMRADVAQALRMAPDEVGEDDNLADLGLDSLRAMALMMRWNDAGLPIEFPDLAEEPTLLAWWKAAEAALARRNGGNGNAPGHG